MQELTLHKPEGTRRVGRPAIRCLDSVEEDLKTMGIRNWRQKSKDLDQWRAIVKEAKVHNGQLRPQKRKKSIESQPTFQRNISPPSSGTKNKRSRNPA
jgi:hypothetical protein